jgi:WD40 repeat protein
MASFRNAASHRFGAALSSDFKTLAYAATDKSVRVWDVAGAKERCKLEHPELIGAIGISADVATVASECKDGKLRLWDASTGKELGSIAVKDALVPVEPHIAYNPDGKTLLFRDFNAKGLCSVFDVATHKELRTLLTPKGGSGIVLSYAFSPDGKAVTVFTFEHGYLFDSDTGKLLFDFKPEKSGTSGSALVSRDGKEIAYLSNGLRVVDLKTGKERDALGKGDKANALAYSPKGRLLAFAIVEGKESKIWDALTGKELGTWMKPNGNLRRLVFGSDGKLIAVVFNGEAKTLELWSLPEIKVDD